MFAKSLFGTLSNAVFAAAMCLLLASPLSVEASKLYDANAITMFTMNSTTALSRIRNGEFNVLYRGFGSRKKGEVDKDELLGFRFILDLVHQSRGLRQLVEANQKAGMPADDAYEKAKVQHTGILRELFNKIDSTKELYENRPGKFDAAKAGCPDAETHFIFTSPRIGVARMYGPIVMVIQETRHRGMDLNGIARDARYYSLARFLKNISNHDFRMILADYFADRDEYVIPSYVNPVDISGMIVHTTSPVVIGNRVAVPPPAVRRVYRKYNRLGAMTIDILDGKDRLIARLSASPSAAAVDEDEIRSPEKLPAFIQEAWNAYLKTVRSSRSR